MSWIEFLNTFSSAFRLMDECLRIPMSELLVNNQKLFSGTTLELDIRCLKALLVVSKTSKTSSTEEDAFISIEDFGNVLNWFGPLHNAGVMFQKIRQLLSLPYAIF